MYVEECLHTYTYTQNLDDLDGQLRQWQSRTENSVYVRIHTHVCTWKNAYIHTYTYTQNLDDLDGQLRQWQSRTENTMNRIDSLLAKSVTESGDPSYGRYAPIHIYACIYVYIYACIYVYIYACIYVYVCAAEQRMKEDIAEAYFSCIFRHTYIHTYIYIYIYIYIHTHTHAHQLLVHDALQNSG